MLYKKRIQVYTFSSISLPANMSLLRYDNISEINQIVLIRLNPVSRLPLHFKIYSSSKAL